MLENYDAKTIVAFGFYVICVIIGVSYLYKKRKYTREQTRDKLNNEMYNNNK